MLVEGYVLVQPEDMKNADGAHHVITGSYETEEQRLTDAASQCVGCGSVRRAEHIPPYQFIGYDADQIRGRLERLRKAGATLCPGCAERFA